MKQVYLRYDYGNRTRGRRWTRFIEQLEDNFKDLLLDWTLEVCCFEPMLGLPDFLTKHKKLEVFRKWYPTSKLDSWEELIKHEIKNFHIESWHKMTERQKIDKLIINLGDILRKEESGREYNYFGNKTTIKILENLPEEIKRFYEGHYEGWLCLKDPRLREFAERNKK